MAFVHGRRAVVIRSANDLSPIFTSAESSIEVENADTTTLSNSGYRTNMAGLYTATYSFEGFYETSYQQTFDAQNGQDGTLLSVCIGGGAAVGDLCDLVSVTASSMGRSASLDGAVAISVAYASQKYVGFGQVLHPYGEDTNSTTGQTKDDAASSATGWTMQLHVSIVDGGTWVVKVQDASASNFSDGADVTGGSFTSTGIATSQRLESASTTTALRRYVRYLATRTGGSAGDGITFFLAYSRNRQ